MTVWELIQEISRFSPDTKVAVLLRPVEIDVQCTECGKTIDAAPEDMETYDVEIDVRSWDKACLIVGEM
jgi:polyferredoxin